MDGPRPHADRALRAALLVLVALLPLMFLAVACARAGYPYQLEWLEGGVLDHARRALAGQPLYVPPGLDFTPFIYTPLYYYVSAGALALLGGELLPLRLVSLLAALGCMGVIYLWVRREGGDRLAGLLGASLLAGCYPLCDTWLDLARVDSLALLLLLGGAYQLRAGPSAPRLLAAAGLLFLSFFTKQTALLVFPALAVYALWSRHRVRYLLWFLLPLAALLVTSTLWMNHRSDGWYSFYVFEVSRQHKLVWQMLIRFLTADLLRPLAVAVLLGLLALRMILRQRRESFVFHLCLLLGTGAAAGVGRLHEGGHVNVLLPLLAAVAILSGLGFSAARARTDGTSATTAPPRLLLLACVIQLGALLYNPLAAIPDAEDTRAGDRLLATIRQVQGPVLAPAQGYLVARAGKRSAAHQMALNDVFRSQANPVRRDLVRQVVHTLRWRRYAAVITDGPWFAGELRQSYVRKRDLFEDPAVFTPVAGHKSRPSGLWVRGE